MMFYVQARSIQFNFLNIMEITKHGVGVFTAGGGGGGPFNLYSELGF